MINGQSQQSAPQLEYGPHSFHEHGTGTEGSLRLASTELSLSSPREKASRKTGYRFAQVEDGHFRSWLFLAPPPGLHILLHAKKQN